MVSLINISNTIGEVADLYTCCRSNKINANSFKKPINNQSETELTWQDYYDANDGFNLGTLNSPRTFYTPQQMLYELQHPLASNIWEYTPRTAPYRLTDFEDYTHYATPICNLTFETDNGGAPNETLRLTCTDVYNMVEHWAYFNGVRNSVDFVYLAYPIGTEFTQGGTEGVWAIKSFGMDNPVDTDTFRLHIPVSMPGGQYECRLCCTTATNGWENFQSKYVTSSDPLPGTWYALPRHCVQTFTVGGSSGGGTTTDLFNYLGIDFFDAQYEYSNYSLNNITFTNYIVINNSTNKTFNISTQYYYDNTATPVLLGQASRTLNEANLPWTNINVNYRDTIYTITDANLDDRIAIRAIITVTSSGTSQTKTISTSIERI